MGLTTPAREGPTVGVPPGSAVLVGRHDHGRLAPALYDLGNQAASRGDFGGAIVRYRQALAFAPDHLAARNNLANALLVSGQVDEAITQYREVLRRNPGDNLVPENLARALEMQRANHR